MVIVTVIVHAVSMLTLDRIIEYKEVTFRSDRVPEELVGYRIAFVSDTHSISAERLEKVVDRLSGADIDLLIIGGDFFSTEGGPLNSLGILSGTITSDGIYGVEGTGFHESHIDLAAAMGRFSIRLLSNDGVYIRDRLFLAGTEDVTRRNPDIKTAVRGAGPDDFILLVSHNPDITMEQDTEGIDLILSGHTHGGQITLFGIWAPALANSKSISKYGQRFMSGWAESRDGVPVYVSNGTGDMNGVPRIFAKPQVVIFTLSNLK